MARFFREDFDRSREFVALRPFTYGATNYVPGKSLNKDEFTPRRLRQLYDMHRIGFAEVSEAAAKLLEYEPPKSGLRLEHKRRPKKLTVTEVEEPASVPEPRITRYRSKKLTDQGGEGGP